MKNIGYQAWKTLTERVKTFASLEICKFLSLERAWPFIMPETGWSTALIRCTSAPVHCSVSTIPELISSMQTRLGAEIMWSRDRKTPVIDCIEGLCVGILFDKELTDMRNNVIGKNILVLCRPREYLKLKTMYLIHCSDFQKTFNYYALEVQTQVNQKIE